MSDVATVLDSPAGVRTRAGARLLLLRRPLMLGCWLILLGLLFAAVAPGVLAIQSPYEQQLGSTLQSPSTAHWFGTDQLGRDIYSRVVYGTRGTMGAALAANVLACLIGVAMGMLAGYFGGLVDSLFMRALDVFLAFPGILLAIAFLAVVGPGTINVIVAVSLFCLPPYARVARTAALRIRGEQYVAAAKSAGRRDMGILVHHVIPNAAGGILVVGFVTTASAILTLAGLSFLGLGPPPAVPEWGAMLSQGRQFMFASPHIMLFPGLAIMLGVLTVNILGQSMGDRLDSRSR